MLEIFKQFEIWKLPKLIFKYILNGWYNIIENNIILHNT